MMRKEKPILFMFLILILLQQGCGSGGSGGSGGAYQGGSDGNTTQISDPATATYMEAYNLFKKLKENSDLTRVDIMTQVYEYLKTQSNVTSVELDASYRIIEFVANGDRFMIDDVEDREAAFFQDDTSSMVSTVVNENKSKCHSEKNRKMKAKILPLKGLMIQGHPEDRIMGFSNAIKSDLIKQSNFEFDSLRSNDIAGIANAFKSLNSYGLLIICSHGAYRCLSGNGQLIWLFSKEISAYTSETTRLLLKEELVSNFPFLVLDGDCLFKYKETNTGRHWIVCVRPSFFRKLLTSKIENTVVYLCCCYGCLTRNPIIISPTSLSFRYMFDYPDYISNDMVNSFLDAGFPVVYASSWDAAEPDMQEICVNGFLSLKDGNGNSISEREGFVNKGAKTIDSLCRLKTDRAIYDNVTVYQDLSSLNYGSSSLVIENPRTASLILSEEWIYNGVKIEVNVTQGNYFLVRFVKDEDVECFFGNDINITAE